MYYNFEIEGTDYEYLRSYKMLGYNLLPSGYIKSINVTFDIPALTELNWFGKGNILSKDYGFLSTIHKMYIEVTFNPGVKSSPLKICYDPNEVDVPGTSLSFYNSYCRILCKVAKVMKLPKKFFPDFIEQTNQLVTKKFKEALASRIGPNNNLFRKFDINDTIVDGEAIQTSGEISIKGGWYYLTVIYPKMVADREDSTIKWIAGGPMPQMYSIQMFESKSGEDTESLKEYLKDLIKDEYAEPYIDDFINALKEHSKEYIENYKVKWAHEFDMHFMYGDGRAITSKASMTLEYEDKRMRELARLCLKYHPTFDPQEFAKYLMCNVHGTFHLECGIPLNPTVVDEHLECVECGDLIKYIKQYTSVQESKEILQTLNKDLVDQYYPKPSYDLPPKTEKILNELGASEFQKKEVFDEIESIRNPTIIELPANYGRVQIARKMRLQPVSVTSYLADFDYHDCKALIPEKKVSLKLHVANGIGGSYYVCGYTVDIRDEEGHHLVKHTVRDEKDGGLEEFVKAMQEFVDSDINNVIALKDLILNKIENIYRVELKWGSY